MHIYQQSLPILLLLASLFTPLFAEKNFDIKNDLFYEHIHAPATEVHQQQLDSNGQIVTNTQTIYDEHGFINHSITNIDNVVITMFYAPYEGLQRKITITSENTTSTINTLWSSPDTNLSSDGDMFIEYRVNDEGYIVYKKIYFNNEPELTETTHYRYIEDSDQSHIVINDASQKEQLVFMTTLEKDQHGSWTKQKEHMQDGSFTIHTRTIKYTNP